MKQRRFRAVTALLSALAVSTALAAVAAPAHAGDRGGDRGDGPRHGDHSHGGGHGWGHGHSRGVGMTLTEEVTAILDGASVEVDGSNGARVGRDDDDLIVISVGGRHRGHWGDRDDDHDDDRSDDRRRGGSKSSNAVVTFTGATVTSEWTGFEVDFREGVVTADVDDAGDVPVLTIVKTDDKDDDSDDDSWRKGRGSRGSSLQYLLTEESAVVLGAVVGTDAFEAGDVLATAGGCGR